ncbi:adenylyltransferase/cytidyltransferase family protein [Actinomycetospora sp. TBRC 11914]|uniref:adenylyltransferase/cytidyltransferase family protein n=1 Tax=Actinomycetospora sp. TBRC 11914 TaxID=2729387 RepID=UPI00145C5C08|nr:adenylyltransferase/cytidyltransferase family protein [Actinomycetospora sp. TBRC 11914]NMO89359.1 adenylyltransferase/cytidyltransferase family protein [Actinomycetospora sp. TBRC 11914]
MSLAAVTGRFQPVHGQHLELFAHALRHHDELVVAVTNPDTGARREEATSAHRHTDAANPFTYFERLRLLTAALTGAGMADRAVVVPFDLTRPHLWPEYVPRHARHYVRAYSPWEKDKAARLEAGGYAVTVLDGDPAAKLDAAAIRAGFDDGSWVTMVPTTTVPVLRALLAER